jgi:hypothetical protein
MVFRQCFHWVHTFNVLHTTFPPSANNTAQQQTDNRLDLLLQCFDLLRGSYGMLCLQAPLCCLDASQFSAALAMCGLAATASASPFVRLQQQKQQQHRQQQQQPEQRVAAFLHRLGFPELPGLQRLQASATFASASGGDFCNRLPGETRTTASAQSQSLAIAYTCDLSAAYHSYMCIIYCFIVVLIHQCFRPAYTSRMWHTTLCHGLMGAAQARACSCSYSRGITHCWTHTAHGGRSASIRVQRAEPTTTCLR